MKKKILSILVAAIIAGTTIPMIKASAAEANNDITNTHPGIRYNPNTPNFFVKRTTLIHESPSTFSPILGICKVHEGIKSYGESTDITGLTWVKIKLEKSDKYGYVQKNDLSAIYY